MPTAAADRRGLDPRTARAGGRWTSSPAARASMGVVNVTPDSFSDGGRVPRSRPRHRSRRCGCSPRAPTSSTSAPSRPVRAAGSTAPGRATCRPPRRSSAGCCRCSSGCAPQTDAPLSVDTRKAAVAARRARRRRRPRSTTSRRSPIPRSAAAVAGAGCPVVLMHSRGDARHHAARHPLRRRGRARCATSSPAALARPPRAGIAADSHRARPRHRLRQDRRAEPRAAARASTSSPRSARRCSSAPAARASSAIERRRRARARRAARRQPRRRGAGRRAAARRSSASTTSRETRAVPHRLARRSPRTPRERAGA